MNQFQRAKKTPEELAVHDAAVKARAYKNSADWRRKNSVHCNALQQKARSKNKEKVRQQSIRYRLKHGEKMRASARAYAKKYPEKVKAAFAKYFKKNQAKRLEEWAWKIAIKKGCLIGNRSELVELYQQSIDLSESSGEKWSVDHIISLTYSGPHSKENCQLMPLRTNAIKSSNPFWICSNGVFKDWRDVPEEIWPSTFKAMYMAVINHRLKREIEDEIVA